MNELKKSLIISMPIAAACLYLWIYAHVVTLIIAAVVVALVGAVIPVVSARVRMKGPFAAGTVLALGAFLIFAGAISLAFLTMLAFPLLIIGTIFVAAAMAKWVEGDAR